MPVGRTLENLDVRFLPQIRGPEGKIKLILNWDGMYYIKDMIPEVTGDWTQFK